MSGRAPSLRRLVRKLERDRDATVGYAGYGAEAFDCRQRLAAKATGATCTVPHRQPRRSQLQAHSSGRLTSYSPCLNPFEYVPIQEGREQSALIQPYWAPWTGLPRRASTPPCRKFRLHPPCGSILSRDTRVWRNGRRAWFRSMWGQPREGSTPFTRTKAVNSGLVLIRTGPLFSITPRNSDSRSSPAIGVFTTANPPRGSMLNCANRDGHQESPRSKEGVMHE